MPRKLSNSMKGLINIKNNVNKCFLWCHIRHLNPLKIHPERITKADKSMVNDLDYEGIKFHVSKKDFSKIEKKNNICINIFCYGNNLVYPVHISDQKFEDCMDLLLLTNENKSHRVCIKYFNRFMCNKTRCKIKKHFCKYCLQCFSSEIVLVEHRGACLKINGKQTVKLRSGLIKFRNHFKQLAVSFKIYADFECNVKRDKSSDRGDIKHIFLAVFLMKLFVLMIDSAGQLFFIEEKMQFTDSLKQFLKSMIAVVAGE